MKSNHSMTTLAWLDTLDLSKMKQGWKDPQPCRAVSGSPLRIAGRDFARGVGTHARSVLWLDLHETALRFRATIGVDDAAEGTGTVIFKICGDDQVLFNSGVIVSGQPPKPVDVDLSGVCRLVLMAIDAHAGIRFGHANWAEACFEIHGEPPRTIPPPSEPVEILTPPSGPVPRINGARVYGCRPGHPFIFRIPATGLRPMAFSAAGLPEELHLDPGTGIISGTVRTRGSHYIMLQASNAMGVAAQPFTIECGDTLALTPPMGWNDWYAYGASVTAETMRAAADELVASGMADFGYSYVNVDDCWMNAPKHTDPQRVGPLRAEDGNLVPNAHFNDMKLLADYIHSKGLKFGIYTSPGRRTCAGFAGSYQHEEQDARQFASWGVDFLKYDWCTYWDVMGGKTRDDYIRPYRTMGEILRKLDRDIVFNLCQYGMCNVWEWGGEIGGHAWRTTGDVGMERNEALPGALRIGMANARFHEFARPGAWNDPDYLIVGSSGDARQLTANEQYSYVAMWALMAAPLFFSGDMKRLDEFTLNLLCNHEIIEVNQDSLGRQAVISRAFGDEFILSKPMKDGSVAVGLFNLGEIPAIMGMDWDQIGISGNHTVRDLWRQQDFGVFSDRFETVVSRHGVVVVRLRAVR